MQLKATDKIEFIVRSKSHLSTHPSFASAAGTLEAIKYDGDTVRIFAKITNNDFKWFGCTHKFNIVTNKREIVNETIAKAIAMARR